MLGVLHNHVKAVLQVDLDRDTWGNRRAWDHRNDAGLACDRVLSQVHNLIQNDRQGLLAQRLGGVLNGVERFVGGVLERAFRVMQRLG